MVEISKKNQMITGRIKTLINKFNRFYVTNKPKSINMINIGYVQNGNYK